MRRHVLLAALLLLAMAVEAFAQIQVGINASNNATVQPAGPRGGLNGKRFFNIEGNDFGTFASFGVVDFSTAGLGLTEQIVDVTDVVLKLYDAPASFSANGTVRFWLSEKTGVDIEPGSSPLRWNTGLLPDGVDTQLLPVYLLGSGVYTKTANDTEFVYPLVVPAEAKAYLLSRINAGATLRLVVTPAENGVAATYAGFNNTTIRPPRLEMTLIPRPSRFSIRGNIGLGDFEGDITQVPVVVELYRDGAPVRTETVYTDANGNYSIGDVEPGTYDIAFKASHWLKVVVYGVTVQNADVTGVNVTLINGDVDGDNEVGLGDLSALVAAFGTVPGLDGWNPDADLNGDEEVGLPDFTILVRNFGSTGDE